MQNAVFSNFATNLDMFRSFHMMPCPLSHGGGGVSTGKPLRALCGLRASFSKPWNPVSPVFPSIGSHFRGLFQTLEPGFPPAFLPLSSRPARTEPRPPLPGVRHLAALRVERAVPASRFPLLFSSLWALWLSPLHSRVSAPPRSFPSRFFVRFAPVAATPFSTSFPGAHAVSQKFYLYSRIFV